MSVGLEEEAIHGGDLAGPIVVGRVLSVDEQVQQNGKTIRYCVVDVGPHGQMETEGKHQEIVCGATNFEVGDLVVVVLPGAVLAGGFEIAARKTYGRMSNGMICAEDELGIGHDHTGIIVLTRLLVAGAARRRPGRRRRHRPAGARRAGRRGQRHAGPRLLLLDARPGSRVLALAGIHRRRLPRPRAALRARTHRGRVCGPARRRGADRRAGRLRPVRRADRPRHRPDPAVPAVDAAPADADGDAARSRSPST